jgi:hypothetical protein
VLAHPPKLSTYLRNGQSETNNISKSHYPPFGRDQSLCQRLSIRASDEVHYSSPSLSRCEYNLTQRPCSLCNDFPASDHCRLVHRRVRLT